MHILLAGDNELVKKLFESNNTKNFEVIMQQLDSFACRYTISSLTVKTIDHFQ
jgi:hypothetical protein